MEQSHNTKLITNTPAHVIDVQSTFNSVQSLKDSVAPWDGQILYSVKACSNPVLIQKLAKVVSGFSTCTEYENVLVQQAVGTDPVVHMTSPGLTSKQLRDIPVEVNVLFCNSFGQLDRVPKTMIEDGRVGLRINPKLSIADDDRYDPCRQYSKLGVSLNQIAARHREGSLSGLTGLQFHNACFTNSWEPLLRTCQRVEKTLSNLLYECKTINLGGGYLWDEHTDTAPLQEAMEMLSNKYDLSVFLEPGDGIINSAGYLVSSVIDIIESDGKKIAILDTTVNHIPEVYEYQYAPDLAEHVDGAAHEYMLAGCSCLAGDLFGDYAFEEPLNIGSRVVFENVGAYSLVKANMFNGINLPSVYILNEDGRLDLVREFTYDDFLSRCGGGSSATVRSTNHDRIISKRPLTSRTLGSVIFDENTRRKRAHSSGNSQIH